MAENQRCQSISNYKAGCAQCYLKFSRSCVTKILGLVSGLKCLTQEATYIGAEFLEGMLNCLGLNELSLIYKEILQLMSLKDLHKSGNKDEL
jgi:hypothetical protein